MKTKYYSCKLFSDIVINASLATEGNMQTLQYIPGSNFWGIVASQLYKELIDKNDHSSLIDIFHNGTTSFGDALIAIDQQPAYALPISLSQDKLASDLFKDKIYVHHVLDQNAIKVTNEHDKFAQLKQQRSGYFTKKYQYIKTVKKQFSLKSAQDRSKRKSEDEKMFGFESIRSGQTFIFSIIYQNEKYIETIEKNLLGERRVGKSKNAQYGQVKIKSIKKPDVFTDHKLNESQDNLLLVYAESNICLIDEFGNNTLQIDVVRDFKIKGKMIWSASQIRTYSYAPWNNFRKTSDSQRDCIVKGSVIAIQVEESLDNIKSSLQSQIGVFKAEGLGRVIYNPAFLQADPIKGTWAFQLKDAEKEKKKTKTFDTEQTPASSLKKSPLFLFLQKQQELANTELKISKAVIKFANERGKDFDKISKSQWGAIRSLAIKYKEREPLITALFGTDKKELIHRKSDYHKGFLTHGVSAQRYWDKNGGKARQALWEGLEINKAFASTFLAKFANQIAQQKSN